MQLTQQLQQLQKLRRHQGSACQQVCVVVALLVSFGLGLRPQAAAAEQTLPTTAEAMATWAVDAGWTFAPGVPESLADQVKAPRMRRDKRQVEVVGKDGKKRTKTVTERRPSFSHPVLVWVPEGATRLRGAILIVANTDSKEFGMHARVREVCQQQELAVVYCRFALQNQFSKEDYENGNWDQVRLSLRQHTFELFDHLARATGIADFAHVPWISFGKSSMGKHAFYPWWYAPERTIAGITYHGETPTWPMEPFSLVADHTILHCAANGLTEWGGTWFKHVRPALLNYRHHSNVLAHQTVAYGVGHGNYIDVAGSDGWGLDHPGEVQCVDTWDYLAQFIDAAVTLRVPPGYPNDAPPTLLQVDPSQGYLLSHHAIEDRLQVSRKPLAINDDGQFIYPETENGLNGFAKIAPATEYQPPAGVPVVPLRDGMGPRDWLLVKRLNFAMKADPIQDQTLFADLRPTPGAEITIDDTAATWELIAEEERGMRKDGNGGLAMKGGLEVKGWPHAMTVLGYTVVQVEEPGFYQVAAGFTPAVRVQLVLNGTAIDHQQVIELSPGLYPLMLAVRMDGAKWGHVEPHFIAVGPEIVAAAQASQVEKMKVAAELAARFADGAVDPAQLIQPWDAVPAAERSQRLWLPTRALADAWLDYHDIERLRAEAAAATSGK